MFAPISDPDIERRVWALGLHCPPALIWHDRYDRFHRRCITDDPNPDCSGSRGTGEPERGDRAWGFTPPPDLSGTVTG
jgi:hypothetical protein